MKKLFLIFLISSIVLAQNYNDAYRLGEQTIDFDAKTLSVGNSSIGALGNFSSAIINPAGLGTIKRDVLSISFNSNGFENNADFLNNSMTSDKRNSNTNHLSIILPLPVRKGSATIAFGYNQSRDFTSILKFNSFNNANNSMIQNLTNSNFIPDREFAWELGLNSRINEDSDEYQTPISGKLTQSGEIIENGFTNNWLMSGAVEVAKNLFIGATINIISGEYLKNRDYYEEDLPNNTYTGLIDPDYPETEDFQSFYLNDIVDWDINGWDFRLGLLYNFNNLLNFGATIKLPTSYVIEEKYSIYGKSEFVNNTYTVDYPGDWFEYKFTTPMELSGGISASLPLVNLNASIKFVDYSQMEYKEGFDKSELIEKNNQINEIFESTLNWNLGAEFTLPYPSLKIRGGFIYLPSPYKDDTSEYDKKYLTAGLGFPLAKSLIIDFAYVYGWWKNFGDNYGYEVSRTYQDIEINKFVLSASYVFM
ncbi:MAG: outer membrane protein transport protein [Ignavibacteriae bacterium]|nr:outer membrane protein transport protein [Ignavibacteriota bacterium]